MNIGGALGTIGTEQLKAYPWGPTVVAIVNTHLETTDHISLTDTGNLVVEKILSLEDDVQNSLLAIDIGPLEGAISLNEHKNNYRGAIVVIFAVGLVVMALFITVGQSGITPNGEKLDSGTMEAFFKMLLEAMKLLLTSAG